MQPSPNSPGSAEPQNYLELIDRIERVGKGMRKALVTEPLVAAGYGAVSRCKSQSGNIRNIVRYGMCIVCKGRRTASLYVQSTQKPSKPQISQTFPVAEVNESVTKAQIPPKHRSRRNPSASSREQKDKTGVWSAIRDLHRYRSPPYTPRFKDLLFVAVH